MNSPPEYRLGWVEEKRSFFQKIQNALKQTTKAGHLIQNVLAMLMSVMGHCQAKNPVKTKDSLL